MVSWKLVLPVVVFVGLLGFVTGVLASSNPSRAPSSAGTIVKLGPPESLPGVANTPWCSTFQHFCVVKTGANAYEALYTYETNPYARSQGCEIRWQATQTYIDTETQETKTGAFRAGCNGSTYDMAGHRVFGPAARDMDRFALKILVDPATQLRHIEIDTHQLICAASFGSADIPCEKAPLPQ